MLLFETFPGAIIYRPIIGACVKNKQGKPELMKDPGISVDEGLVLEDIVDDRFLF